MRLRRRPVEARHEREARQEAEAREALYGRWRSVLYVPAGRDGRPPVTWLIGEGHRPER